MPLDPEYEALLRSADPAQAMKRIEATIRAPLTEAPRVNASAGRSVGSGYGGTVGAQMGPLSGGIMAASDPYSGQPVMVGGRANIGPVGYAYMQPTAKGAPAMQSVSIGGKPFDADTYFGVQAQRGSDGMSYGANVARGNAFLGAQYNPTQRAANVMGGLQHNFNHGGTVHMDEGGLAPLTIRRQRPPEDAPVGPREEFGPAIPLPPRRPVEPAAVSEPEAYNRRFAETVMGAPAAIGEYFAEKAQQPDPSQRIAEDIAFGAQGLASIPGKLFDYLGRKAEQPDPSQQIVNDVMEIGGKVKEEFVKNPGGFMMDMANVPGMVTAVQDAARIKREYNEAVAAGDEEKASSLKAMFGGTMLAGLPLIGPMAKIAEKGVVGAVADVAMRNADETVKAAEKFAGKAGTPPEEMASMFDDVRGTQVGKMVERYQDLPPEEAMQLLYQDLKGLAVEGDVGKEWYERSSQRILDFVGGDKEAADKFAQLIAIYSPQTAVDVNTQNAMKAYNRSLAGEKLWDGEIINPDMTFPTIKASDDYVRSLGGSKEGYTKIPLDDSGKRFLIAKHGDTKAYENIATLDRDLKAHLVMNEDIPFNGRKINNFYNNLMVQIDPSRLQGSTQDLWMARAFGYLDDAVGGGQKYELMERMTADLAAELGWQPHQVQAAIWTAMKTRQEGVKDAVKAAAIEMGLAERVPDPNPQNAGKMIFQVKEGKEAEFGALMRERALGADVTPEAIAAAARDFSDFLDQNIAFITWEATPSTKVGHLEGFENLTPEAKAEYQVGMQQALQDADGNDLLARYLNMLSPGGLDAPGYWDGASNPQRLTQVGTTRIKAAGQAPTIDSASREMMEIYASAMGLLLKQDGVGFHRPYYNPQISKANGMEYKFAKPLSSEDIVGIGRALEKRFGTDAVGLIPVGNDTVRVINFYWPASEHGFSKVFEYRTDKGRVAYAKSKRAIPKDAKVYPALDKDGKPNPKAGKKIIIEHDNARLSTNEKGKQVLDVFSDQRDFQNLVDEVINSSKMDNSAEFRVFGSDGDLVSNKWQERPNGEDYVQRLRAAGRSDVLEYLSDFLAPRVEAFDRAFAAKHGLKRNEALEQQIRNAKQLADEQPVERAEGGLVGYAEGGEVERPIAKLIHRIGQRDLTQLELSRVIKRVVGEGTPAAWAHALAGHIIAGRLSELEGHSKKYPRILHVLKEIDEELS